MSDQWTQQNESSDTSDVAQREAQRMKGTAKGAASNVGDTAAERGREMKGQARRHATNIMSEARGKLRGHADEETQRAGSALSTAGDQLQALADGRVDDAGILGDYVEQVADYVNRWADTIQDRGLDGLLDDVREFGRRRPGMFLLSAAVAGVAVGRFGRNVAPELDTGDGPGDDARAQSPQSIERDDNGDGDHDAEQTISFDRTRETTNERTFETDRDGERADDDLIVGHATDDRAVINTGDDVPYEPIDVDQGRSR